MYVHLLSIMTKLSALSSGGSRWISCCCMSRNAGWLQNKIRWSLCWLHRIFPHYRRWEQRGFLLLLCRLLLTVKSSGRQACHPILSLHPLLHTFKCALGNGACVLVPKVVIVYGYSHAPQVTDVAGHVISRGQVNELHPCVLAVCQYEIVFHFVAFLMVTNKVWAVVSTATHSKFPYVGNSRAACEPFLYTRHVVFGSDDCRMFVYLRKSRAFVILHPTFEAVRSPCVRIGEHIVQNLDRVAERHYQRFISCAHRLPSLLLRFNHSSRNRLHSSSVGFTQENSSPVVVSR